MRLTWKGVEEAASLMGWSIERKAGSQVCNIDLPDDYKKFEYNKERALVHILTALRTVFTDKEIRDKLEWRPATIKGRGIEVFEYMSEEYPGNLCAVMSRIWPNHILDS